MATTTELCALFRKQFPELPAGILSATDLKRFVNLALEIHALNDVATVHCAAHLYALEQAERAAITTADGAAGVVDSGSGQVQSQTVGGMSVSYAATAAHDRESFFGRTPYGRTFLQIENRVTVQRGILLA